jgi:hypothetical protein
LPETITKEQAKQAAELTVRIYKAQNSPRTLTVHGMTLSVIEWARLIGVHEMQLYMRLNRGATDEEAVYGKRKDNEKEPVQCPGIVDASCLTRK